MKPIWVVLIAVACLGLGLLAGLKLFAAPGVFGGMVTGSSYGACSVALDLVEQNAMSKEKAQEFYGRFAGRLESLLKASGLPAVGAIDFSKCEADIEKFRKELADATKK